MSILGGLIWNKDSMTWGVRGNTMDRMDVGYDCTRERDHDI